MTLEPLFSTASSTCPAGNSDVDTSHASSVAVTVTTCSPSAAPLFSVQPVTAVRAAAVATAVTAVSLAARMRGSKEVAEKCA